MPTFDLDIVPVADIRALLTDYFDQCWGEFIYSECGQVLTTTVAHRSTDGNLMSPPWEEILKDPGKYYAVDEHRFSMKLNHPQNLSTIEVLTLAGELLGTSVVESGAPFRFLSAEEAVLVPPSRPTTPEVPAETVIPGNRTKPASKPAYKRPRS